MTVRGECPRENHPRGSEPARRETEPASDRAARSRWWFYIGAFLRRCVSMLNHPTMGNPGWTGPT